MYQRNKLVIVIGCLSLMLMLTSCGKGKPEGIPSLHPATVTVKNGSSAIADARVVLIFSGNSTGSWAVSGATDANGVAKLSTKQGEWSGLGVPEGDYVVFINKSPEFTPEPMPEEIEGNDAAKAAFNAERQKKFDALPKIIPTSLTTAVTSPLKITVTAGTPAELAVDISEYSK